MEDMTRRVVFLLLIVLFAAWWAMPGCQPAAGKEKGDASRSAGATRIADGSLKSAKGASKPAMMIPDTALIPKDKFGDAVRYGRQLLLNTAYYIGPEGVAGRY